MRLNRVAKRAPADEVMVGMLTREDRLFVRAAAKSALNRGVISGGRYQQILIELDQMEKSQKKTSEKQAKELKSRLLAREVG